VIPALAAAAGIGVAGLRLLRQRDESIQWMRIGAAAALLGVAVQGIFETGLTLPANGMLAAVAAAILVHDSRQTSNAAAGH
jgi:hypothetical protein